MNAEQLAEFRRKLLKSKAELDAQAHAPDVGTVNHERIQMLIAQVDQALAFIENGTAGFCEDPAPAARPGHLLTLSLQLRGGRERASG